MIDTGFIIRLKRIALGVFLVLLVLSLLSVQTMAAEEGTVEVGLNPSPLALSVFAPDDVIRGNQFEVIAQIHNLGDGSIESTIATIHLDETGLKLLGNQIAEKQIGTIEPDEVIIINWRAKAIEPSTYIILVSVSGKYSTGDLTAQDSAIVIVNERSRGLLSLLQGWYQQLFGG